MFQVYLQLFWPQVNFVWNRSVKLLIAGPSTGGNPGGSHLITQPGPTQTYRIFLPITEAQISPYFPSSGLFLAIRPSKGLLLDQQLHWNDPKFRLFQPNFKSSNCGAHNNYKSWGRGGRGGSNPYRNTPGSIVSSQPSYTPQYPYDNPGAVQTQPWDFLSTLNQAEEIQLQLRGVFWLRQWSWWKQQFRGLPALGGQFHRDPSGATAPLLAYSIQRPGSQPHP